MTRSLALAKRIREVLLDGHWIANTNFKDKVSSITWQQANKKVGNLNTIAALTYHINYYLAGVLNVLNGGTLDIHDQYSFDMQEIQSEADWTNLVNGFLTNSERFADQVERVPDHQLDQPFVDERYGTYLRNLEGIIEHSYYHLGQISLIKKMIT